MSRLLTNLKKIRARIDNGWTQYAYARNRCNAPVPTNSRVAVSFCLIGAINRECGSYFWFGNDEVQAALVKELPRNTIRRCSDYSTLLSYNDHPRRSKEQIVRLFDRAIARASKCK